MTYFKPSISSYSSISDCEMILDELKIDLLTVELSQEQIELVTQLLENKKREIEDRYNR